jgi:hypothetical protein
MTTKKEMIEIIKGENPTLQIGDDEKGYTQLSTDEYDAVINEWANVRLAKEKIQAELEAVALEAETKQAERKAIFERLGLTADEAKLLLG